LLAELYNIIGDIEGLRGNIKNSINYYEKSFDNAHKIDNYNNDNLISIIVDRRTMILNFNIALCQVELWEIDNAKKHFEYSLEIADVAFDKSVDLCTDDPNLTKYENDCLLRIRNYRQNIKPFLSCIYASLGMREKALSLINLEELEIPENLSHSNWHRGYSILFYAQACVSLKYPKKAFDLYSNAIEFANNTNYIIVKSKAMIGLSEIYRQQNDLKNAYFKSSDAIDILKKINAKPDLANAYFQHGLTYQAMGENDQAEAYKDKALVLFEQMEAPKQIERVNQAFEQGAKQ